MIVFVSLPSQIIVNYYSIEEVISNFGHIKMKLKKKLTEYKCKKVCVAELKRGEVINFALFKQNLS